MRKESWRVIHGELECVTRDLSVTCTAINHAGYENVGGVVLTVFGLCAVCVGMRAAWCRRSTVMAQSGIWRLSPEASILHQVIYLYSLTWR